MDKANVFKSSSFHMDEGDVLHLLFRDETGVTMDVDLWSADTTTETVPDAPTALNASDITDSSFTANWYFNENTTGYYLDVATDSAFTAMVAGYNNLDVGNVNTYGVAGLNPSAPYYYRLRAYNGSSTSTSSEAESLTTDVLLANDWFLPSKDELNEMYLILHLSGLGGFSSSVDGYHSSTEWVTLPAFINYAQRFDTGAVITGSKNSTRIVRPIRHYTSSVDYALRGTSETGGLIFKKTSLGGGFYDYYESWIADIAIFQVWTNPPQDNIAIGATAQGTAIGTGQSNTTAIIGQAGHTNSAAKLCDDLIT